MVKYFQLSIGLKVEITERLEDKSVMRRGKINSLLKEFLKDDNAIYRLYRLWLVNEIKHNFLIESILTKLPEESDTEIIEDVLKECPESLRSHFQAVLKEDMKATNNDGYSDLEAFFGNFGLFDVGNVTFEMMNHEDKQGG